MVTEEQRERWRAKAQKRERQLARAAGYARYWKDQGPVRFVLIMGVLIYVLPLLLLNERILTWERPEIWWPVRPYAALFYLALGMVYGWILWAVTMRAARKRGDLSPDASTSDRGGEAASVRSAPTGSDVETTVRMRRVLTRIACFWVVVLAVAWILPYFLSPIPGGRVDRWQLGVEHPEPGAVYFGERDSVEQRDREERLKRSNRCVSEPRTEPREGWYCGQPAVAVVHYLSKNVSAEGQRSYMPVYWPACESHLPDIEARLRERAHEALDPEREAAIPYKTIARAQWTTPPKEYSSLWFVDDPTLPGEFRDD